MAETLVWITKDKEIKVKDLNELLDALVNMDQEDIDAEIIANIKENKLLKWLEENFPKQMELITHLRNIQEFTPQQIREQIVRDLRKLT